MFADALAEEPLHTLAEILWRSRGSGEAKIFRVTRLEQAEQTFHADLVRQAKGVCLKWIRSERTAHVDHGFAFVFDELSSEDFVDQFLHSGITQVQPVAGAVAEKTAMAIARADNTAGFVLAFNDDVVLTEMIGARETGEARADDEMRIGLH